MRLGRNLQLSIKALVRFRIRTALALSGMAVGVGAVLVMTSVGEGSEREILREIDALGKNLLMVSAGEAQRVPWRNRTIPKVNTLVLDDAEAVLDGSPYVALVAPEQNAGRRIKYGSMSTMATVRGTTVDYEFVRDFRTETGRYFTREENRNSARVAVLGARVRDILFPDINPIGESVLIGKTKFQIIGVLERKGITVDGASEEDNQIVIPIQTAMRRVFNIDHINMLYVQVDEREKMDVAREEIAHVLRTRHRTAEFGREDDFDIRNQSVFLEARLETIASFRRMIFALGAVAITVGGIGILSVMMLAVRERRNEIGLRVAVGAKRKDILIQFLLESLLLGFTGGLLGVSIAVVVAWVIGKSTDWQTAMNGTAVVVGILSALGIGVLFGVYPAQRAAVMDPIDALRAE